jgi:D-glycero-D-manno-heptose 1,7-bisphosphate phosphatase
MTDSVAVFVDRDGTIIEDVHYANDPTKIFLLPGAAAGLRKMREKGYLIYVVSNQSGVGRGLINDEQFRAVHEKFCHLLQQEKVEITEFVYCFHRPEDECNCRKPRTGLIPKITEGKRLDWKRCFTVGDSDCDLKLGDNMGAQAFLIQTGKGLTTAQTLKERGELARYVVCHGLSEVAEQLPISAG